MKNSYTIYTRVVFYFYSVIFKQEVGDIYKAIQKKKKRKCYTYFIKAECFLNQIDL